MNPVVAPCEDMLPYIPILIHHLWNVRKCVVSRGLEHQPHREEETEFMFYLTAIKDGASFSTIVRVCLCLFYEMGGGCQGS